MRHPANPAVALAADKDVWGTAAARPGRAGLPLPETRPPIQSTQQVQSLMSVLSTGILYGPAGKRWRYRRPPATSSPASASGMAIRVRSLDRVYDHREISTRDVPVPYSRTTELQSRPAHQPIFRTCMSTRSVPLATVAPARIPDPSSSNERIVAVFLRTAAEGGGTGRSRDNDRPGGSARQHVPEGYICYQFVREPVDVIDESSESDVTKLDASSSAQLPSRRPDAGRYHRSHPRGRSIFQGDFDFTEQGYIAGLCRHRCVDGTVTWLLQRSIRHRRGDSGSFDRLRSGQCAGHRYRQGGYTIQPRPICRRAQSRPGARGVQYHGANRYPAHHGMLDGATR